MANLTQRDHHWRKCHAPGVEQVEILYCTVVQKMANRWPISPHVARPSLEVSAKLLEMNM